MSAETTTADPDTDHAAVEIETHGRIARAAVELLDTVSSTDGVRMQISDDELRAEWVDPPNVGMGEVCVDLDDALESIESVESEKLPGGDDYAFLAGIRPDVLGQRLSFARKTVGGELGDPVRLRFEDGPVENMLRGRTCMTIRRRDGPTTLTRESAVRNPDPASLRQREPVSIDHLWRATIEPATFSTVINAIDGTDATHVRLRPGEPNDDKTRALVCEGHGGETATDEFRVGGAVGPHPDAGPDAAADETEGSLMSLGYLTEIADSLTSAKMDRLNIEFKDAYPVRFAFSRGEWGISGAFLVAPRITSDDDHPGGRP